MAPRKLGTYSQPCQKVKGEGSPVSAGYWTLAPSPRLSHLADEPLQRHPALHRSPAPEAVTEPAPQSRDSVLPHARSTDSAATPLCTKPRLLLGLRDRTVPSTLRSPWNYRRSQSCGDAPARDRPQTFLAPPEVTQRVSDQISASH